MAESVQIVVTADDNASAVLKSITGQFGGLGQAIHSLATGKGLSELGAQVIKFGQDSIKSFTEGAQAAKQLSMVSGESIENASRFLQVLDDYEISQQDALAATKALTKEGLAPNIETLAKLSDQYRAIKDPQEKNEFIIKNLGRAGLEWAKVLDQGSAALYAQGQAISDNLIYTEEMYEKAEKLRLAQDELNDAWEGTKITVGSQLVPALTGLLEWTNAYNSAQEDQIANWERWFPPIAMVHGAFLAFNETGKEATDVTNNMANAQEGFNTEIEKTPEQIKAEQDAIKELTKANQDYLSMVGDITSELQGYQEKHNDIQAELNEGNITIQEAQAQWAELAREQELATNKMILSMLNQRLAADGLNEAEMNFLLNQGVQWGIYSREAVDRANDVIANVDHLVNQYNNIPGHVSTDIVTNHIDNYFSNVTGYGGGRAGGGPVSAGMLYRVNETRQEFFQPSVSGTVLPLGNRGNGGNGQGMTFVYSPQVSMGDAREAETVIMPFVEQAVRKMQSDGRAR